MGLSRRARAIGLLAAALALRLAAADETAPDASSSVWDGVYTEAQAERGESIYPEPCGRCHGASLNGAPEDPDMLPAPPIGGPKFLRNWDGRSLAALFEYTRRTMPAINPGYLTDQEFADLLAYMLAVSEVPPGADELPADPAALERIVLRRQPEYGRP